jgi:uncharacterized protein YdbL (DUF1318 family)
MKVLCNVLATVLLLAGACAALAAELEPSKRSGLVGERADGYLGLVVATVPADVAALVNDVNRRRRAEYERIASQNGLERTEVEALAGRRAIERTAPGDWVFTNGGWKRK